MIILDLFCGAGGLSEGFKNAGFNVVAGIDNDFEALETYSKNFPEAEAIELDLSGNIDFKSKTLQKLLKSKIDVIVGGPPCQGLSIAGKRIKEDPRNNLYIAYKSMIEKINYHHMAYACLVKSIGEKDYTHCLTESEMLKIFCE